MKTKKNLRILTLTGLLTLALQTVSGQFTHLTGGMVFGTPFDYHHVNTGNPGIQLGGIYELNLPFHLAPVFTWMLPNTEPFFNDTRTTSLWGLGLDAHYVFNSLERFEFYGLGGMNISFLRSNYKGPEPDYYPDYHENVLGINLGAGTYVQLKDPLHIFAEAKYVFRPFKSSEIKNQFFITAGIMLNVQWLTKNE
ncbi:MAG: porin family protein [Chlorobi bacterium]|nr:porin family protein [Chlorobiota bacterium]